MPAGSCSIFLDCLYLFPDISWDLPAGQDLYKINSNAILQLWYGECPPSISTHSQQLSLPHPHDFASAGSIQCGESSLCASPFGVHGLILSFNVSATNHIYKAFRCTYVSVDKALLKVWGRRGIYINRQANNSRLQVTYFCLEDTLPSLPPSIQPHAWTSLAFPRPALSNTI